MQGVFVNAATVARLVSKPYGAWRSLVSALVWGTEPTLPPCTTEYSDCRSEAGFRSLKQEASTRRFRGVLHRPVDQKVDAAMLSGPASTI
jgi:hypothetical protein